MSVEIQSFVLCASARRVQGGIFDLEKAAIYEIFPVNGGYPFKPRLWFYLLLRKDTKDSEIAFEIKLRVVDADGAQLSVPGENEIRGVFPRGYRFWPLVGGIDMVIQKPGSYAVLIDTKSAQGKTSARYDFEALFGPNGGG